MKSAQLAALTSPLLEVIGIGGIAFIVWYGGFSVIDGQMKPGEFFSFLAAMFMAYAPLKKTGQRQCVHSTGDCGGRPGF